MTQINMHDSFGEQLRQWRQRAGLSQLDLALKLELSTRHLSYIETGKASPSETLLYAMLRVLEVPAEARNTLLAAAGFRLRPLPLQKEEITPITPVLKRYLQQATTAPVIVKDAIWDVIQVNSLARRLFLELLGRDLTTETTPINVLQLVFDPELLHPKLLNWENVADSLIAHIRHEAGFASDHLAFREVLSDVSRHSGFEERWSAYTVGIHSPRSTLYRFNHKNKVLNFESVLMSWGSPYDAVLRGIRLDSFLPIDVETQHFLDDLANEEGAQRD